MSRIVAAVALCALSFSLVWTAMVIYDEGAGNFFARVVEYQSKTATPPVAQHSPERFVATGTLAAPDDEGDQAVPTETFTPLPTTPASRPSERSTQTVTPEATPEDSRTPAVKPVALSFPTDGLVGNKGLLPGTRVAVVSGRSEREISYDLCTVAFSLPGKGGKPWAITAGHCGQPGQKVYSVPDDGIFDHAEFLGTIRATSAANYDSQAGDWAGIRLSPKAHLPKKDTKITPLLDTRERKDGARLCKVGATTGFNCGSKEYSDVKAAISDVGDDSHAYGMFDAVKLCALPGDSGGPIFDRGGIVGVLSATTAGVDSQDTLQCEADSMAYYTPMDRVLEQVFRTIDDVAPRNYLS